jgi:hypothetical protein
VKKRELKNLVELVLSYEVLENKTFTSYKLLKDRSRYKNRIEQEVLKGTNYIYLLNISLEEKTI